jgi:DNA-binding CsgD family transcriptional regulator
VLPRIEDASFEQREHRGGAVEDDGAGRRRPSKREREILGLLARGSTDTQIAEILGLSPATVQTHVRNAKAKLGARTRAQAVALALVGGLIELD